MFREYQVLLTDVDFARTAFCKDHSLWEAAQAREVLPRGEVVCPFLLLLTQEEGDAPTHLSCCVGMCIVFQEQLSHPYLPVLGSHMERGKSFLRRNTGHQDPWEPMPPKEGTGRMLPVLTSMGMPM